MLKRYMHKREREHAMRDNNRIVREFGWGMEFIDENANGANPHEFFREYSRRTIANSGDFFCSPEIPDYELSSGSAIPAANQSEESRLKTGLKTFMKFELRPVFVKVNRKEFLTLNFPCV